MSVSGKTEAICDKALAGIRLSNAELIHLFNVPLFSEDYYHVMWARNVVNFEAAGGLAEVQTQLGLDANPCEIDCQFCSLGESNNHRSGDLNMPMDEVMAYVNVFMDNEVNVICLMATAGYNFSRYLDVVSAVRAEVGPDMPLMANIADFDLAQARELKAAGIGSIYHSLRMGEGIVNKAVPAARIKTMEAAKEAGILLGTGMEMIAPRWRDEDIAKTMQTQVDLEPHMIGAKARIWVADTPMPTDREFIKARHDLYSAAYRLLATKAVPFCGGDNVRWSSVGYSPHDYSDHTERLGGYLRRVGESIPIVRQEFKDYGYTVLDGPSLNWDHHRELGWLKQEV